MAGWMVTRAASAAAIALLVNGCNADAAAPDRTGLSGPREPIGLFAPVSPVPVTLDWQAEARRLVGEHRLSALAAGRLYAAMSVAQDRALAMADRALPADDAAAANGYGPGGRTRYEARRGAVSGASARVLGWFFPAAAPALGERVTAAGENGAGPEHPAFAQGVALGVAAGDAMIVHLQNDGFTAPWTGTVPTGPGVWIPGALPPAGVMLGSVTPYFLTSGSQFRPAPPPAWQSAAFEADLAEVVALTQARTPEQLAFAKYWDFPAGTFTPIGYWNDVAAQYVAQDGLDERAAAQVFALMHAAMFDALIGCWEAKYHYWTIRPSQANGSIPLAFGLPNFPSYPSGHSCASASGARVLAHFFPDREAELEARVQDAGLSRILAGIHYRFDITAGQQLGRAVADWAIAESME